MQQPPKTHTKDCGAAGAPYKQNRQKHFSEIEELLVEITTTLPESY